jgi:fumarylpyruvate hydrolase
LVFAAPATVTVPVTGGRMFPVRRIYCVGRNYAEHIREMGGDERELPFFFQKPTDAIVLDGAQVPYPPITNDLQHEVELVLAIGAAGAGIPKEQAALHVFGVAVGIDLTRRDLQIAARKSGRPWEIGKAFDHSAPCSDIAPRPAQPLPKEGSIELQVNGASRQSADLAQMIWAADEIVSKLSEHYVLMPGDLIYTGTPAGVGPLHAGDTVEARIEGIGRLRIGIAPALGGSVRTTR